MDSDLKQDFMKINGCDMFQSSSDTENSNGISLDKKYVDENLFLESEDLNMLEHDQKNYLSSIHTKSKFTPTYQNNMNASTPLSPRSCTTPKTETDLSSSFKNSSEFNASSSKDTLIPNNYGGMTLPIDDNEFIIIKDVNNNEEFVYDIYCSQDNKIFTPTGKPFSLKPFSERQSLHFDSSNSTPFSKQSKVLSPQSQSRRTAASFSNFTCPGDLIQTSSSLCNSPLTKDSIGNNNFLRFPSFVNHSNEMSFMYDQSPNSDSNSKEKYSSIFDSTGLFIKKDHPIFTQSFSTKVFVGGLPRDITIGEIEEQFSIFGDLIVDWPNRGNEKVPPNGFAFLHFKSVSSVEKLHETISHTKNHNKFILKSHYIKSKEVEVKFWWMKDSEVILEDKSLINPSYSVFVGALPRVTTARELAAFMEKEFTNVVYTAIDVDLAYGYPKGAGRVTFRTKDAYMKALNSHFIVMEQTHVGRVKKIEIKPFILPDQKCEICYLNRGGQYTNKYCYACSMFICETCEFSHPCVDGQSHKCIGRSSEQRANEPEC